VWKKSQSDDCKDAITKEIKKRIYRLLWHKDPNINGKGDISIALLPGTGHKGSEPRHPDTMIDNSGCLYSVYNTNEQRQSTHPLGHTLHGNIIIRKKSKRGETEQKRMNAHGAEDDHNYNDEELHNNFCNIETIIVIY